mmetsp:Transcript_31902/g.38036  ORF Transcript_31902/g.38036 Transcript_31902/m.38036 type:complete len:105 (-) Transcript_31902:220-534(-)
MEEIQSLFYNLPPQDVSPHQLFVRLSDYNHTQLIRLFPKVNQHTTINIWYAINHYFFPPPPNNELKIPPNPDIPIPSSASFLFFKILLGVLTGTKPLSNLFLRS